MDSSDPEHRYLILANRPAFRGTVPQICALSRCPADERYCPASLHCSGADVRRLTFILGRTWRAHTGTAVLVTTTGIIRTALQIRRRLLLHAELFKSNAYPRACACAYTNSHFVYTCSVLQFFLMSCKYEQSVQQNKMTWLASMISMARGIRQRLGSSNPGK